MSDNFFTIKACVNAQRVIKAEIREVKSNMLYTRGSERKQYLKDIHDLTVRYYTLDDKIKDIREHRKRK